MTHEELRKLALAATPGRSASRDINSRNRFWGPRLLAFKDAVWPEDVIALLDEIERLERSTVQIHRDLVSRLNAMTAARDEACFLAEQWMSDDWHDSATAHERLTELRKVGQ